MLNGTNPTLNSDLALVSTQVKTLCYTKLGKKQGNHPIEVCTLVFWFVLLLYVPSQQLWSLRDGQLT